MNKTCLNGLSNTLRKFHGRHTDVVGQQKNNAAKYLLIMSVKMIYIFMDCHGQINKIRKGDGCHA